MACPHHVQALLFSILICCWTSDSLDYEHNSTTVKHTNHTEDENISIESMKNITSLYWFDVARVLIPPLYTVIFVIGLPANALGLWIMITKLKKLPSTIFLINLAVADLIIMFLLVLLICKYLIGIRWEPHISLLFILLGLFYSCMYCSILLLTFISIDRYFALVHPFLSLRFRGNSLAWGVCLGTWALVLVSVLLPQLLELQIDIFPEYFFSYYYASLVTVEFALPCAITLFCYASIIKTLVFNKKKYKRAVGLTTLTLLVYLLCFTPSNAIMLTISLQEFPTDDLITCYVFSVALSCFSSCLDPFIYCFVSNDFRARVKEIFCCCKKGTEEIRRNLENASPYTTPLTSISTAQSMTVV